MSFRDLWILQIQIQITNQLLKSYTSYWIKTNPLQRYSMHFSVSYVLESFMDISTWRRQKQSSRDPNQRITPNWKGSALGIFFQSVLGCPRRISVFPIGSFLWLRTTAATLNTWYLSVRFLWSCSQNIWFHFSIPSSIQLSQPIRRALFLSCSRGSSRTTGSSIWGIKRWRVRVIVV